MPGILVRVFARLFLLKKYRDALATNEGEKRVRGGGLETPTQILLVNTSLPNPIQVLLLILLLSDPRKQ